MQMDCKHCRDSLWDFVAQELSHAEAEKIEEHLQGCPSCRQEAEQVKHLVSALREEIPLPASFSAKLHEKLSQAAGEMATETPSRQKLPRWGGFKALAPALACLALVIGVFSSGLYDQWRNADQILTEPPVTSAAPIESSVPAPAVTNPATAVPQPEETSHPAPVETSAPAETMPVTEAPAPASVEDTPSIASAGTDETPTGFAIPRHRPKVACLMVADGESFLNNWQEATGYEWKTHIQDVAADEIVSGVDPGAMVLVLSPAAADSLMDYAEATEPLLENQGETLVIITGDEE